MGEQRVDVYLEIAAKRVFAGAVDWPGWDRSGRDEAGALEALLATRPRYARALGRRKVAAGLPAPATVDDLRVVERRTGGSGTEFGIPSVAASGDDRPADPSDHDRLVAFLDAAWAAFDRAAETARDVELRKGPRGGGRDLAKIVGHVLDAEKAYLTEIGGRFRGSGPEGVDEMTSVRAAAREMLVRRLRGEPVEVSSRRRRPLWTPRYFVRRSAWHALDHAWEIEDRVEPAA